MCLCDLMDEIGVLVNGFLLCLGNSFWVFFLVIEQNDICYFGVFLLLGLCVCI